MGTLASNRKGYIVGATSGNYAEALDATTGTASDSHTSSATALQYFRSSGRGGGTFRFIRTFLHFNTSGISGGSDFSVQLTSGGANSTEALCKVTAVKHTAGSSSGGELANSDFNNVLVSTPYSNSTTFGSSGTVEIGLNAAAVTQIVNNSDFNVAILLTLDLPAGLEEDPLAADGDVTNIINFGSAINLVYTDAASGYTHKINTLAAASIGKVNTLATASIDKINTK
jgi:hypothetical protein